MNKKNRPRIPGKTVMELWFKSGGRCEFEGCNKPLWKDGLTSEEINHSHIAHIIAVEPNGPRGDKELSPKLATEFSNLMLTCREHHNLIDNQDKVDEYPVERLTQMKKNHEDRIELLTSLSEDKQSAIVLYGANVGMHDCNLNFNSVFEAMKPLHYPKSDKPIEIGLKNSMTRDNEEDYWHIERENLRKQFREKIKPLIDEENHISLFAIAPQPLLIELGRLFGDIRKVEVYQLHREPQNWKWQTCLEEIEYVIIEPEDYKRKNIAVNISISDTITNDRIIKALGDDTSIWTITVNKLGKDFIKSPNQLSEFRKIFRSILGIIKQKCGHDTILNVFPVCPISVAIEIGRVWMPKADMKMRIYEENKTIGGFYRTFDIE